MRRVPQQHPNPHVRRERDRRTFTRQTVLLAACALLAAGFIFATRQKIAAVQYGYRSEELRRERERLLEERRRLLLEIEENSSPVKLERAARELGLQPARAAQVSAGAQARRATDEVGDVPAASRKGDDSKPESRAKPGEAVARKGERTAGAATRGEQPRQVR